jgi:non-heme chloroperoxidase
MMVAFFEIRTLKSNGTPVALISSHPTRFIANPIREGEPMPYVTVVKENSGDIDLYYKDWGTGQSVVFSHGWPLSADAWEDQMFFLASRGYRCIAHDRRGPGRSSQPWNGNDMDTYADNLAKLVEAMK